MSLTRSSALAEADIHDILRNDRRRRVLEHLQESMGSVTLRELAETIAAHEAGESPPPRPLRESVYNSLHQTHLPKLDAEGVVDYDKNRKTVELQPGARDVNVYMEVVTKYGITWADYYRSLATLSLVVVVAAEIDVPLLEALPVLLVASAFLAVIAASTAYQLWTRRWTYLRSLLR
ncbi:DUF7344 domain-containing protein [Halobacterium bonnevillei]|uniref:DUF7344 domain-containing protein n=1 Tax=Halobacterium bonnevillei TaxID=2692200 RepID=A0A6B0SLL2_9EURY|nr:hypothetical protein [Halobacterium bonnevillei]MXR19790.1 hypothetical protein [Halobacterium bonnevillei]